MKNSPVVRAIDLGFGFSKFTAQGSDGSIEFKSFPSLAPRHIGMDLAGSVLGRRDTVVVNVEGTAYEVGPDSMDLDPNDSTRNLNDSYVFQDQYKAVFLGTLHYMQTPKIDMMVLGLPVIHQHYADHVRKMAIGKHEVAGKEYEVRDVLVLSQPVGGLNYCISQADSLEGLADMQEDLNLVVDAGFLTLDFVAAVGDRPVENRSGAHTGGVSKVLRAMAESISQVHGLKFENLSAIDRALRRNKLKINGEVVPLEPHIRDAKSVIEGSVSYLKNVIGSGADLDNIILLGGGAFVFRKTLAAAYPRHKIVEIEDSQTANVRGFYRAGLKVAA